MEEISAPKFEDPNAFKNRFPVFREDPNAFKNREIMALIVAIMALFVAPQWPGVTLLCGDDIQFPCSYVLIKVSKVEEIMALFVAEIMALIVAEIMALIVAEIMALIVAIKVSKVEIDDILERQRCCLTLHCDDDIRLHCDDDIWRHWHCETLFFKNASLLVTVCGTKSGRDSRPQTGRLDVYVGDKRLLDPSFRKFYGIIEEIISVQKITVRSDLADETRSKMFVSLELVGPEKDNWQHCMNKDGATLLPKRQRLYIDQLLRQLDATGECHPQAAHWLFETSVDCPPLTCLQAQLEFQQLTSGATPPTAADKCSSDGEGVIRLRVKVSDAPSRCCGLQG